MKPSSENFHVSPPPDLKVRLIAPAWLIKNRKEFLRAVSNLEKIGFKITNPLFSPSENRPPEIKARELTEAFTKKFRNIRLLILAIRGGYGSIKLLPFIDFSGIKKEKSAARKILAGFSDISALLNPLYEKTGIVGLHSPMLWNFSSAKYPVITLKSFINALAGFPEKNLFRGVNGIKIFRKGNPPKATGTLKGGNMVTLGALIGTPWETDTRHTILFLEDVDEKKHEIDRMFSQWAMAGKFDRINGLILGDFRGTKPWDVFEIFEYAVKKLRGLKINFPVVHCPSLGHTPHKITLPVGLKATLDTSGSNPSLKLISSGTSVGKTRDFI